jgi:hypothetical protein
MTGKQYFGNLNGELIATLTVPVIQGAKTMLSGDRQLG